VDVRAALDGLPYAQTDMLEVTLLELLEPYSGPAK